MAAIGSKHPYIVHFTDDFSTMSKVSAYLKLPACVARLRERAPTTNIGHLYTQLLLVYRYNGMTGITLMRELVTEKTSATFLTSSVLTQAVQFTSAFNQLEAETQSDFPFLRLIRPAALEPLTASYFPGLYYAAISVAQNKGSLSGTNYAGLEKSTCRQLHIINSQVPHNMTESASITSEDEVNMKILGMDPITAKDYNTRKRRLQMRLREDQDSIQML